MRRITWNVSDLIRRSKGGDSPAYMHAWRRETFDGVEALCSYYPQEPAPLTISRTPKGRYAVTLGVLRRPAGSKETPGCLMVERKGCKPWVVTNEHPQFFLGVLDLDGGPLVIRKANLGIAGVTGMTFEAAAPGAGFAKRATDERSLSVLGICDQNDFVRSAATADAAHIEPMMRYHRELGFNAVSWHMYCGCCEYPTAVGTCMPTINPNDKAHLRLLADNPREPYLDTPWREFINRYDTMELGIRLAHQEGLKFLPCLRVNNEWGAAWALHHATADFLREFWQPEFFKQHPEFWSQYKDGAHHGGGMDFSHAEVRKYRLGIVREVVANYPGIDGLFIDLHRHPPMVGYPDSVVAAFRQKYGIDVRQMPPPTAEVTDPRWRLFRTGPFTEFMRGVKKAKHEMRKTYPTVVRTARTFDQIMYEGVDLETWFDEKLVDVLVLEQHRGDDFEISIAPVAAAAAKAGVKVVGCFNNPGFVAASEWPKVAAVADKWLADGASGVAFYESNMLVCHSRLRRNLPAWVAGKTKRRK